MNQHSRMSWDFKEIERNLHNILSLTMFKNQSKLNVL